VLTLTLYPADYVVALSQGLRTYCLPQFMGLSDTGTNFIILGDTLLRAYYADFDVRNETIGACGDSTPSCTVDRRRAAGVEC
jgi:hypothetical protein